MSQTAEFVPEMERYELAEPPRYHFDVDRREFFKLLGGGLVVLCVAGPALAQESGAPRGRGGRGGRGGQAPADINAWLHIGEDGAITVFTGKTEVGQNIRTSLTQAVAEELRAPVASIKMVMADTQLTPYDAGTFGSQTTPQMASNLHRVAAAAREALLDLAADHFKADRSSLAVANGKISKSGASESVGFGELTKGQKIVKSVSNDSPVTPAADWKIAGTSVPKVDGRDFVTGKHKYSSDIRLPGMLHGKVLRAPAFQATLESIDTTAAQQMPGVTRRARQRLHRRDRAGRLERRTRHQRHPRQMDPQTPALQRRAFRLPPQERQRRRRTRRRTDAGENNASTPEAANAAAHKLQATYTVAYIAHTPLEPRAAVAQWDGRQADRLDRHPDVPSACAPNWPAAFGLTEDDIRVIVPDTGSGYGGKHTGEAAIEAARLAKAAGRPGQAGLDSLRKNLLGPTSAPPALLTFPAASATTASSPPGNFTTTTPAVRPPQPLRRRQSETSRPTATLSPLRQGSYRALAATANNFARESHMDELAHALKMDPLISA